MNSVSMESETSYSAIVSKPSQDSKVGISFIAKDEGVHVSSIVPGGIADNAGIKTGDRIIFINGHPAGNLSAHQAASLLRKGDGKIEIIAENPDVNLDDGTLEEVASAASLDSGKIASTMSDGLGMTILIIQVVMVMVIKTGEYGSLSDFSMKQYSIFRDIMVMLLLGFGYLMTFLEKYGLSAVGLTMLVTVLNMECNLLIEGGLTHDLSISLKSIINAEFSAAALLISFGALIGRATPLQMVLIAVCEALFYTLNKVYVVFGSLQAEDVGGTITIHMFGAFFGLAAACALGPQRKESVSNNSASRVSDVFSLVGTTLLWVYWPSFVGATETGVAANEMRCLENTIMALIGSTGAAFYLSQLLNGGKFDAVHIQNSTLAGGVAIGATARLAMGPGMAFIVGLAAGLVSVLGYFYSSPFLEKKFGIYDTCGVGNLHGYPSVFGGLLSILLVYLYPNPDLLQHAVGMQSLVQLGAVTATIISASVTGYLTGIVVLAINPSYFASVPDYEDMVWWLGE
mmetsp:Transcript_16462/g.24020  ORF Transcript_16462/g.24020 Transcript_16462/m.24020 type:complete len:515 (+) Transcript_16462:14-1558(+)